MLTGREKENCGHPASRVKQYHDPATGDPTYWCLDCLRKLENIPRRHCIHARRIGKCHLCADAQKGLNQWINKEEI